MAAGAPPASAAPLGVLLDYAAGVITAADLRASGAVGAIRYVSDRRPGGDWMLGKPIQLAEARDLYHGRSEDRVLLPVRQAGHRRLAGRRTRGDPACQAGLAVARRRGRLRTARRSMRRSTTIPPLSSTSGRSRRICAAGSGCSATSAPACTPTPRPSTGRCRTASAHTSGSTTGARRGVAHPAAHLHQVEIDKRKVGGVGVDINHILKPRFGQWD